MAATWVWRMLVLSLVPPALGRPTASRAPAQRPLPVVGVAPSQAEDPEDRRGSLHICMVHLSHAQPIAHVACNHLVGQRRRKTHSLRFTEEETVARMVRA